MRKDIELLNDIIFNAILEGADAGGSYGSNGEMLIKSIKRWMEFNHLKGYSIQCVDRDGWLGVYQIVKEEE